MSVLHIKFSYEKAPTLLFIGKYEGKNIKRQGGKTHRVWIQVKFTKELLNKWRVNIKLEKRRKVRGMATNKVEKISKRKMSRENVLRRNRVYTV